MNLNQMRVGQRLGLGFGLMAVLLALSLGVAIQRLNRMEAAKEQVLDFERRAAAAEAWMKNTDLNANRALAIAKSGYNEAVVKHFDPLVKATTATISEIQKGIEASVSSERGKALMETVAGQRKAYIAKRNQIFELLKGGDLEGGQQKVDSEMLPAVKAYLAALEDFVAYQREQVRLVSEQAAADKAFAQTVLIVMLVVCVAVAAGAGWLITRSVTGPLQRARRSTEAIADGDLTQDMAAQGSDELADLQRGLEQMQQRLRTVVGESAPVLTASTPHRTRLPRAATICRSAPRRPRAICSRPPARWSSSPPPPGRPPTRRRRPTSWPVARPRWRGGAAPWSPRWCRPWATSTPARDASPTSSAPSTASRSRPTSWP